MKEKETSLMSFEHFCEEEPMHAEQMQVWVNADEGALVLSYDMGYKTISLRAIKGDKEIEVYGLPIDGVVLFLNAVKSVINSGQ